MSVDMAEFEGQFDDFKFSSSLNNDDFERVAFLKDRISDIEGVIELREGQNKFIEFQMVAINKVIARLEKMLAKYKAKRRPFELDMIENKAFNKTDTRAKESLERELRRLLDEIAARQRLIAERNLLDSRSAEFPWSVGVDGKKALAHQREGAHRLVSAQRGILGDKPGLGKTLQAIMTIDLLRLKGQGKKVLIFTPKPVLADFERAFKQWTNPTFVHVLNQSLKGIKTELLEVMRHMPEAIVITNYEVWRKDASIKKKLAQVGFDTIILDEAHNLKNSKSVTFEGIREIVYAENLCPKCGGSNFASRGYGMMCGNCEYQPTEFGEFCSIKNVYPMTGTVILNKPQDLFALLNLIDREAYPSEGAFLRDYCKQEYNYGTGQKYWTFKYGGSETLLKKLGLKYTARTRDSAGVEMPPQEVKHHWLELDPEKYPRQYKFNELLKQKAKLEFSETEQMTTQGTLAWYTRFRQAASWPDGIQIKGCAHEPECVDEYGLPGECYNPTVVFPKPGTPPIGESVLLDEAEMILREAIDSDERIVVFSMFKAVLKELEKRCQAAGISVARFDGETSQKDRQPIIDDFNANITKVGEHKFDVMLAQYQTASVGLNLHGAHQLIFIEREWNPGKEEQALDRLRRIDSQYDSTVHILHCAGTATDLIDMIQDQKKGMLENFEADVDYAEAMRKFLEG